MKISRKQYLKYLNPIQILQTKKVLKNNPTYEVSNEAREASKLTLLSYNSVQYDLADNVKPSYLKPQGLSADKVYWLNSDIIHKPSVESISKNFNFHYLIVEDILSENERPKVDEMDDHFTCVMHMLYYNTEQNTVENEQVSFVLGNNVLITFQDDSVRDSFDSVREKLKIAGSKIRTQGADYLLYSLIDSIVDEYFNVLEKVGDQIELLEEEITNGRSDQFTMNKINALRKELIFFKRNATPVKELIGNIVRTDHALIMDASKKYFKDVYDHAVQINDLTENYRDVITNVRDLYLSQMNMKMNEAMKFTAIITALLAPATVIGGIFGMNFDKLPYIHHQYGFFIAAGLMIIVPIFFLIYFKRKGWF